MKLTYFPDTDTLDVVYANEVCPVAETMDGPTENILLDFDEEGRVMGITYEHASRTAPAEWKIDRLRRHIAARAREIGRRVLQAEITTGGRVMELVTEEGSPESPYEDGAVREYNELVRTAGEPEEMARGR